MIFYLPRLISLDLCLDMDLVNTAIEFQSNDRPKPRPIRPVPPAPPNTPEPYSPFTLELEGQDMVFNQFDIDLLINLV
jgi:hypothetical protein